MFQLYIFMKSEYLENCLKEDEIKVSLPESCNDPFEFIPAKKDGYDSPDTEGIGFICFSEEWASSTMWAHYAEKHKGVCVEFAFPLGAKFGAMSTLADDEQRSDAVLLDLGSKDYDRQFTLLPIPGRENYAPLLMKVKYWPYRSHPAKSQIRCVMSGETIEDARYSRLFAAKGQEWSYEKEWRLFVTLDNCLACHDSCYFVKGLTKHITKVMLGWKCDKSQAEVSQWIQNSKAPAATCVKMEPDGNLFAVKEEGTKSSDVPPVWRLNLEFSDTQWMILKDVIKTNLD